MSPPPPDAAPLLLVGALWAETLPLARRLEGARPLSPRLLAGRLAGRPALLLTAGVGRDRAARRTARVLARAPVVAVLSFGTCGALTEDLPDGSLVTAHRIGHERGGLWPATPLPGLRAVAVATVDEVVTERPRRARLAAAGFAVCEMEALGVAEAAGERPLHALKIVSDQAGADASPRFDRAPLPSPLKVARFQLHAFRLVEAHLLPVLMTLLREGALGP